MYVCITFAKIKENSLSYVVYQKKDDIACIPLSQNKTHY